MASHPIVSETLSLLHVEDDPLWSVIVAKMIGDWPEFRLVGSEPTGAAGIACCQKLTPEIVLLDLRLPDMDGFAVMERLCALRAPPRIVLLSGRNDDVTLSRLDSPHIAGMLLKLPGFDHVLREALALVAAGGRYFSPEIATARRRFLAAPDAFHKILSEREQEVLRLVARGYNDVEIATSMGIGRATAHSHRQNILNKVNIHCSRKLMVWAREKGFA